jgi:hypothetical protein
MNRAGAGEAMPEIGQLSDRMQELQKEAEALLSTLDRTSNEIGEALRARMASHPYAVLATAAGIGYVLGGGLPSPLTRLVLLAGGRIGFEFLSRELGNRLREGGASGPNGGSTPASTREPKGNGS